MKITLSKPLIIITLCSSLFAINISSCSTVPKEISEELTAQELIQKGQTEFEYGRYKASLAYYNTVCERYADAPAFYLEAYYEIGHLYMKQKKYEKAKAVFEDILHIYADAQPGTLPGSFRKLSEGEMEKIKAKEGD